MPNLTFSSSPLFAGHPARQATFTRHGGVSIGTNASLNVSYGVGDDTAAVVENRRRIKTALGISRLFSARQEHGDRVMFIKGPLTEDTEFDGFDALVTNIPDAGLMIQQADCQAVMLYDPVRRAVANIHAGWRGSVAGVIAKTIATMTEAFGSRPAELLAAISPSLGPCCAEFIGFANLLPEAFHRFETRKNHFDFLAITRTQLLEAGVVATNISVDGRCTVCCPDFFSYRRDRTTGRFGSIIALI